VDQFRRVGGELVPYKRPTGRRALLPSEAELCNAIGLSEEEYWHFVELTEAYNGKRAKEYELVPDVENGAVAIAIVSLVIGLASTAASFLLAPKPRAPQVNQSRESTPPSLRTADQAGTRRFAPQTNFDSVQELASLGQIIPLIFTRKGVRVTGQLLWSQMLSLGNGQQLRAIMLFGSRIEARPHFPGFAIGDTLLENYTRAKLALYFKADGGRPQETDDRYPQGIAEVLDHSDAFSIFWDRDDKYQPYFSGVRTPSTQTQFGAYSPMPNGNAFKVNYELTLRPASADNQIKQDIDVKRAKISNSFPCRAAIVSSSFFGARYRIEAGQEDPSAYAPWGLEDVNSAVEAIRINADEACSVGDLYLVGERFGVGSSLNTDEPWNPSITKDFRILWSNESPYTTWVEAKRPDEVFLPYQTPILQRAAVAVVSNNRECDATEIGIKSTVWKQINGFPNVNSQPPQSTLEEYEAKNGSIALGAINKYISRLSFFRIFARPLGRDAEWTDLNDGTLFCVKGQTPQPQYNYFRFVHPRGQYEFKFVPVPGNLAHNSFTDRDVFLLRPGARLGFNTNNFTVVFSGIRYRLTANAQSNSEWILGAPPPNPIGNVIGVSSTQRGSIPTYQEWVLVDSRENDSNRVFGQWANTLFNRTQNVSFIWDGNVIGTQSYNNGNLSPITQGNVQYRVQGDGTSTTSYEQIRGGKFGYAQFTTYKAAIGRYELRTLQESSTSTRIVDASGGSGGGLQFEVLLYKDGAAAAWSIHSAGSGYKTGDTVYIPLADVNVTVQADDRLFVQGNLNPYDAVADFILFEAERTSHMDSPEHEVVYVSEQLQQVPPQYENLAIAGIRINSTKEWANFSSLSAFIRRGTPVERLTTSGTSATNLLPEIAYALLTDETIGAGASIGAGQVDRDRMVLAARFCQANGFTWDGVISERINLREWIFEQAGYCMLDFTILGGRFSLVPSVPYNSNYTIKYAGRPTIKALFTDGNIRKMKVTWLSPEERRLFKATCLWRQDTNNGFPETKVLSVRLSDQQGGTDGDPEETFDMSGWCTTQKHAYTFARYALKLRQLVDHSVTFETTPQAAMNLAPGEYFRLVSEVTHTSRFNNGSIGPDGAIQSTDVLNGSYAILYWEPGTVGVKSTTLEATNGRTTQTALFGKVFTINNTTTVNRVYKVETLSYGEDGLVEITASHVPLTSTGSLAILDWNDDMFVSEVS
jgi:hypothetical protein